MQTAPTYPEHANTTTTTGDLQAVVDRFYTGLHNHQGSVFAGDCQRRINGVVITNDKDAPAPDQAVPSYRPYSMTCAEQFDAGVFNYISAVRDQRVLAVDTDRGLVMDLVFYDVANPAQPIQVASIGTVKLPPASTGSYSMMAAQLFHIVDGKIAGIDTMQRPVPYGMSSGW